MRLDLLLHRLRFAKHRSLARALVEGGLVRIDGRRVDKPGAAVGEGQVLTIPTPAGVRVIRILTLPSRRGPASEARACYEEVNSANVSQQAPSD